VIYLTEAALEIAQRRIKDYPSGALFRNSRAKPLARNAIRCRFRRYGKGLCATLLRHTFVTEGLIAGIDSVSMAVLCGHSDPSMVAKQYQHLAENPKYLKELLKKVRT
jgi:integrase